MNDHEKWIELFRKRFPPTVSDSLNEPNDFTKFDSFETPAQIDAFVKYKNNESK